MTPERWQRVEAVFELVADLSEPERALELDAVCVDDEPLRAEVKALLSALEGAPTRIQAVIDQQAEQLTQPVTIGQQLGRYRVLDKLGEGGMGVVFLAERDDGEYQTKVAIKLLRGLESRDAIARFRDERQILATLEHPGIVRLLDGGSTDAGQPYLVMEYVAGVPITRHVVDHQLALADRLELFNRAAAAVAFAHQRLIVHRDLKPSNMLVTDAGLPKLLDFGIAKLLDREADREASTRTGMQLLTPEYASPEQVRGELISTASDIYSLGAVLYELCTGAKAQPLAGESVDKLLRAILDHDPVRPSTVMPAGATAASLAPRAWRRALRGDLDNIILKALHKRPDQRYASVEQLIEDIERHLDGLPVKARAATFSYRAGKFVRRNLVSVAAAGVVLAALTSATLVSLRQAERADEQAENAEQQRRAAELQAGRAREQATVARARAQALRDTLRIAAAQQALDDPTLAVGLLREVESAHPQQLFGWLRAVPHFNAPAFVTTALLMSESRRSSVAAWSPDGTKIAIAWPDQAAQIRAADGALQATLTGQRAQAVDLAWSPDSSMLVTATQDALAQVWRADGTPLAALGGESVIGIGVHLAWSPDGSQISTISPDKTLRLWRPDGTLLATLGGHANSEIWARWSPDGNRLLTGSPWNASVRVWRSEGTLSTTFTGPSEGVRVAEWSPDGEAIVTSSEAAGAVVWRAEDGQVLARLEARGGRVRAAAWSPDGTQIALGSSDHSVTVCAADGSRRAVLHGHTGEVVDVQWSPDGRWIATASEDRTARVWLADGTRVALLAGHRQPLLSLAWRPNASAPMQLLTRSSDATARIWQPELNLPRVIASQPEPMLAAAWSPDRSTFATTAEDHDTRLWQRDGTLLATLPDSKAVRVLAWNRTAESLLTSSAESGARVWRRDGTLQATLSSGPDELLDASWSARGEDRLASAHADGSARVWRADGTLLATLLGHTDAVRSVAWSSDGQQLLTGSWDATARVWQADGTSIATLYGHEAAIQAAAFSPDDSRIATASMDRSARIWRSDGTLVAQLAGASEVESVTFSPEGSRLVTTSPDRVVQIWRAEGGLLASLAGHEGEITSVVWSRDGARVLTATSNGIDGAARLWTADGQLLATLAHQWSIVSATLAPGDTHVLTAAEDGKVREWRIDAAPLLRGFWLSTPHCPDAAERQRVLAETRADAEFGQASCQAMQACLRDDAGVARAERFESCLAEYHARGDAHY